MSDNNNSNNSNNNQMQLIQDMINNAVNNALNSQKNMSQNNNNSIVNDVHNSIKNEREQQEKDRARFEKEKEDALFINNIYYEIEKNSVFLPNDAKNIVDKCMKAADTDNYKKQLIQKELLDRVFEIKENVEKLSDTGRREINEFLSLTDEGKLHRADKVYHLIADVVNVKKNLYALEEKKKQAVSVSQGGGVDEMDKKEREIMKKQKDFLLRKTNSFTD